MNFMNDFEIDEALVQFHNEPVLGAAAKTLANLRDVANANSDGWAYWPKPARSANKLMRLLQTARRSDGPWCATAAEVRAAYGPIKGFLTRENLSCDIVSPG